MTSPLRLSGGCQCGGVAFNLAMAPLMAYACHCTNCQRITTSAFALTCIVPRTAFSQTKGVLKRHEWSADSGTKRHGLFCPDCGVRIAHGQDGDPPGSLMLSIRAGALDDKRLAMPAAHIWMGSAAPWFQPPADDLTFDAQPSDYAPIAALWRARMGSLLG